LRDRRPFLEERIAPPLKQPTRRRAGTRSYAAPIRSCSRWGLPLPRLTGRRGALLPHLSNLAAPKCGGLLSVALFLGSPPPAINRRLSMSPDFPPAFAKLRLVTRGFARHSSAKAGAADPLAPSIYSLRARGPTALEEDGAALAVDDSVEQLGRKRRWKATTAGWPGSHHNPSARARSRKPPSSSADRSAPRRPGDTNRAARAAPNRTIRRDPVASPAATSEGPTILAGTPGGVSTIPASKGNSASICCSVNGR